MWRAGCTFRKCRCACFVAGARVPGAVALDVSGRCRGGGAGRRLAPVADDVATALAPAVAASRLAWRSVAAAATAAARGDGAAPGPYS